MNLFMRGIPHNLPSFHVLAKIVNGLDGETSRAFLADVTVKGAERGLLLTEARGVAGLDSRDGLYVLYALDGLQELRPGDVVLVYPDGELHFIYRVNSPHNTLLVTERCNSNCLMCSQPPKDREDIPFHYDINMQLIDLVAKETRCLGITGGEPTLLGERLVALLAKIRDRLPATEVQVLTNGRAFAWKQFVEQFAGLHHDKVLFCIPLYSDYSALHDYIVQANDAFAQTVLGIHNLARFGLRTEIRVVLHKQVIPRLPALARFIYRNMPFVEHVAFMGLEYTGYTPHNDDTLWIDPVEYSDELREAVTFLGLNKLNVSIYNLQLCLLPRDLWRYARKSISDWKNIYLDQCNECDVKNQCAGFFTSSQKKHSLNIKPIRQTMDSVGTGVSA